MRGVNTATVPTKMRSLFMKTRDVHSNNTHSFTSGNFTS